MDKTLAKNLGYLDKEGNGQGILQDLGSLRIASRGEIALVCGGPGFVEAASRRLFLAGLPRRRKVARCAQKVEERTPKLRTSPGQAGRGDNRTL